MAAVSPSSTETLDRKSDKPDSSSENPSSNPNSNPDPAPPQSENLNPDPPNPNPNPTLVTPPPPSFTPSFRPLGVPLMPQYSNIPNPNPSPGIHPPGVSAPVMYGSVTFSAPPMRYPPQNAPPMGYGQFHNGYMGVPPPGIPRYPGPYPTMMRPGFPPRPLPPMGVIPQIPRPPIPGVRGVPPMVSPIVRPVVSAVAATEKPQTTVYVGKIAATVDNEFLLSLLRLCGPVKSWKRPQGPSNGSPKGFGFCEFEAAEGILRALRLLTKLNIDGQELVLNINQTTREYLERYVEKKTEREKLKETENQTLEKDDESAPGVEKQEPLKTFAEETPKDPDDSGDKENQENQRFGIVTDEDREADKVALEKITSMIEERLKTKPLPPPPPVQAFVDTPVKSNSEVPSKSRDGDSDVDIFRTDAAEDDTTSETKPATERDKPEMTSPERGRRHDRRSQERDRERERDRDHDSKRDKERELEKYERERERERVRRERERDSKIREAERFYNNRLKEWEAREREQEHQRLKEKEREKDRLRERRREVSRDEDGSDDDEEDTRKRRRKRNTLEEKRRKRQREKEEDLADRLKEEEEIAEANKREIEEQKRIEETMSLPVQVTEEVMQVDGMAIDGKETPVMLQNYDGISFSGEDTGHVNCSKNIGGEPTVGSAAVPDIKQSNDAPSRKLGFGLVGSGKKTNVPSVFLEEEDENVEDKKMKPLVPIDYSTEELQAIQPTVSSTPLNLVAAAEFAKRISGVNPKEEKPEIDRERNGRPNDKVRHRERYHNDDENPRYRNENKERIRDRSHEREKNREDKTKSENKKLLDAKQLIDMIPKTKEELFAYEINWAVFDKHELHEKMRPWISKKITEFLGEEEKTLVDYIVSSTKEHVQASNMLELLRAILDDEAEMFVLKMWRMLIFEIKRVETGLSAKSKA